MEEGSEMCPLEHAFLGLCGKRGLVDSRMSVPF